MFILKILDLGLISKGYLDGFEIAGSNLYTILQKQGLLMIK